MNNQHLNRADSKQRSEALSVFDWDLIQRYDATGPRYTSYPTAVQFVDTFGAADYREYAVKSNHGDPSPLSLYFHIPFCSTLCFYCACNKVVTKNRAKGVAYLNRLLKEVELHAELFDGGRRVQQLHFGGGTPTFFDTVQIEKILATVSDHFQMAEGQDRDFSIEIDPRTVDPGNIAQLCELGFNRFSLGVQDFDPEVQKAVHRIQSPEQTMSILNAAREAGAASVNVDLIYGLPLQTVAGFQETLERTIAAGPDRVCIFNYAHLPQRFAPQRRIREADLPAPDQKLEILQRAVGSLTDAGYRYIGMDHFARAEDGLSKAQDDGTLQRSFQGYTTHAECDLIGLGVSSIGWVNDCYSQNCHDLDSYYEAIDAGRLPVVRGLVLTRDDKIRREVIMTLMCFGELECSKIEDRHGIVFDQYFQPELCHLASMESDGLLCRDRGCLTVTPAGRALVRNICMVFDAYLGGTSSERFSRLI